MNDMNRELLDRRIALDPTKYKPKFYTLNLDMPVQDNGLAEASIVTDNTPFVCDRITHMMTNILDPDDFQDGQYLIDFRDDQTSYVNVPTLANCLFGNVQRGDSLPLPCRIYFRGASTINVRIQNLRNRGETGFVPTQLCFHGFEAWG